MEKNTPESNDLKPNRGGESDDERMPSNPPGDDLKPNREGENNDVDMPSNPPDDDDLKPNRAGESDDEEMPSNLPDDDFRSSFSNSNSGSDIDVSILDPIDPGDIPVPGRALRHKVDMYRSMNIARTSRGPESIANVLQFIENMSYSRSFLRRYNNPDEFCLRCFLNPICNFCLRNIVNFSLADSSCSCSCSSTTTTSEDEGCSGIGSPDCPPLRIGHMFPDCPPILKEPSGRSRSPVRRSRRRRRRRRNSPAGVEYFPLREMMEISGNQERDRDPVGAGSGFQRHPNVRSTQVLGSGYLSSSLQSSIRKFQIMQAVRNGYSPYSGACCGGNFQNLNNQDHQPCQVPNCQGSDGENAQDESHVMRINNQPCQENQGTSRPGNNHTCINPDREEASDFPINFPDCEECLKMWADAYGLSQRSGSASGECAEASTSSAIEQKEPNSGDHPDDSNPVPYTHEISECNDCNSNDSPSCESNFPVSGSLSFLPGKPRRSSPLDSQQGSFLWGSRDENDDISSSSSNCDSLDEGGSLGESDTEFGGDYDEN